MKRSNKFTAALIAASAAALLMSGCMGQQQNQKASQQTQVPTLEEEGLGLRHTSLLDETVTRPNPTRYSQAAAGTSQTYTRAFQDAPPMISHSVEGMLPVSRNNNQCTACHMPQVAPSVNATPIPESHFLDMRPRHKYSQGNFEKAIDNMKNETSVKKIDDLSGSRFNCTQCHAPQSQGELAVENTFEPEFTSTDGKSRSSWSGSKLHEGLDTIMK
ncbi:MAG: nitrate reductase cytochrome c-type subunit [Campylobacterota bacterium]